MQSLLFIRCYYCHFFGTPELQLGRRLIHFLLAVLLTFTLLFVPSSSVSMSFVILAFPIGGRQMMFHFSIVKFILFLYIEFSVIFLYLIKILPYYVYYYCILGCFFRAILGSFVLCLLISILSLLFFYFSVLFHILAGPMRECLGKHSCLNSIFPISMLNETCSFVQWNLR